MIPTATERSEGAERWLTLESPVWRLDVDITDGVNPKRLQHLPSGMVVADEDYHYQVDLAASDGPGFVGPELSVTSTVFQGWRLDESADGGATLVLTARLVFGDLGPTDLLVEHSFTLDASARFTERLAIVHWKSPDSHTIRHVDFGFRKGLFDRRTSGWRDHGDRFRLSAVPFRRFQGQSRDYLRHDYGAADLIPDHWKGIRFPARSSPAWSWTDGTTGMLVTKYTQEHLEFSRFEAEAYTSRSDADAVIDTAISFIDGGNVCLRFGGAARVLGAPGLDLRFDRERTRIDFGPTTIEIFAGGWQDGHRAFGALMRERGHVLPEGFDPPVHWNEIYTIGWRAGLNSVLPTLEQVWSEAAIAQQLGAESFYFDPGWDFYEGSNVWAEDRLGPMHDVVARLRDEFGLGLGLHLFLDDTMEAEDPSFYRRDPEGGIPRWGSPPYVGARVCVANPAWQDMKAERAIRLADAGVNFLLFDYSSYLIASTGGAFGRDISEPACWATDHGHSVPMTLEEHARGFNDLIRKVKKAHPELLIMSQDEIAGDYTPVHYNHDGAHSYGERWGFEFMWDPYLDLLSGKALSLYEYNLAYDIPLYLHINLRLDNPNALAFWWYASTCRHMGIGGLTPENPLWDSAQGAMRLYRELKPHFARGRFVGFDTLAHAHVLDAEKSAVITLFNLDSDPREVDVEFDPGMLGLPAEVELATPEVTIAQGKGRIRTELAPYSPAILPLSWA